MSYTTEFLTKAKEELVEAWAWYEERQPGLGDRFIQQVHETVAKIEQYPERYPSKRKFFREAIVKIFPYLLIYRINEKKKVIAVVSVFHTKRNPRRKYSKKR